MKTIQSVLKIVASLAKYAGVLIIIGEAIEFANTKFTARYGEAEKPAVSDQQ